MSADKVSAILSWPEPTNKIEILSFLGFANFYHGFIEGYSRIILPLTRLLKKDAAFDFDASSRDAFHALKHAFASVPVLQYFDPSFETILETDASDCAIAGILSQRNSGTRRLHPIAYMSRKLQPTELNYSIGDKKLLAIVASVDLWRHYLDSIHDTFTVLTDHKNLTSFTTARVLVYFPADTLDGLNDLALTTFVCSTGSAPSMARWTLTLAALIS